MIRRIRPRARDLLRSESGSASLEFVTVGVILLVPLVYLVLAVAAIQAGVLATEGAARHAARVYSLAPDDVRGATRSNAPWRSRSTTTGSTAPRHPSPCTATANASSRGLA